MTKWQKWVSPLLKQRLVEAPTAVARPKQLFASRYHISHAGQHTTTISVWIGSHETSTDAALTKKKRSTYFTDYTTNRQDRDVLVVVVRSWYVVRRIEPDRLAASTSVRPPWPCDETVEPAVVLGSWCLCRVW